MSADAAAPSGEENTKHAESDIAVKCFQKGPGGLDGLGVRTRPPKACGKERRGWRLEISLLNRIPSRPRCIHCHHALPQQLNTTSPLPVSTVVVANMFSPNSLTAFSPPETGLTADFGPCFLGCKRDLHGSRHQRHLAAPGLAPSGCTRTQGLTPGRRSITLDGTCNEGS